MNLLKNITCFHHHICIDFKQSKSRLFRFGRTSIIKDHQGGIDMEEKILFRVESHVFAGEEYESK